MPERINGGQALFAVGAVTLVVSLFLHWYEPGLTAWTVFEVWDIVLAAIGVAGIVSVLRLHRTDLRDEQVVPERWLPALAGTALVIVVVSLINHPPAAQSLRGNSPEVGAWLALGAVVLMSAGAILSRARISLVISLRSSDSRAPAAAPPPPPEPEARDAGFEADTATQPLPPSSDN
jgi:hypothetical protein